MINLMLMNKKKFLLMKGLSLLVNCMKVSRKK